jgi:GTP-binding protein
MHPLFSKEITFVMGVAELKQLPDSRYPEIALIGRSNVGKSTLLNAIAQRTHLARASATPGRTRQLNYFLVADTFYLVDMPGYGYAKAPKGEVEAWNALVKDYLRGRAKLERVLVLIDARRGILENDIEMMKMLDESAVSYMLVLTKADKLSAREQEDIAKTVAERSKKHPACHPHVAMTSAEKGLGILELQNQLAEWMKSGSNAITMG